MLAQLPILSTGPDFWCWPKLSWPLGTKFRTKMATETKPTRAKILLSGYLPEFISAWTAQWIQTHILKITSYLFINIHLRLDEEIGEINFFFIKLTRYLLYVHILHPYTLLVTSSSKYRKYFSHLFYCQFSGEIPTRNDYFVNPIPTGLSFFWNKKGGGGGAFEALAH